MVGVSVIIVSALVLFRQELRPVLENSLGPDLDLDKDCFRQRPYLDQELVVSSLCDVFVFCLSSVCVLIVLCLSILSA